MVQRRVGMDANTRVKANDMSHSGHYVRREVWYEGAYASLGRRIKVVAHEGNGGHGK